MEIRVEFIVEPTSVPRSKGNNKKARRANKDIRDEIREILRTMRVNQSFKVYGMESARLSAMTHGIMKGAVGSKREYIQLKFRGRDGFSQCWRTK